MTADCRFRDTDRTGLYIMVFLILVSTTCNKVHPASPHEVRQIVREELRNQVDQACGLD